MLGALERIESQRADRSVVSALRRLRPAPRCLRGEHYEKARQQKTQPVGEIGVTAAIAYIGSGSVAIVIIPSRWFHKLLRGLF
jgi:hypothetical protein